MTPAGVILAVEIASVVITLCLGAVITVGWRRLNKPWRFCLARAWAMYTGVAVVAVAIAVRDQWTSVALMYVYAGILFVGAVQAGRRFRRADQADQVSRVEAEAAYRERCRRWQYRAWHHKTPNLN